MVSFKTGSLLFETHANISECCPPVGRPAATVFNHAPVEPQIEGSTYTWELKNLPFIRDEADIPTLHSMAPWLALTYFPASDSQLGHPELEELACGFLLAHRFDGCPGAER